MQMRRLEKYCNVIPVESRLYKALVPGRAWAGLDSIPQWRLLLNLLVPFCIRQKWRTGDVGVSYHYLDRTVLSVQCYHSEETIL